MQKTNWTELGLSRIHGNQTTVAAAVMPPAPLLNRLHNPLKLLKQKRRPNQHLESPKYLVGICLISKYTDQTTKSKGPRTFPALPIREGATSSSSSQTAVSASPELTKKQAKTQAWREGMKEKKKEKRNEQTEQVIKEMKAAISASDLDSVD